ncbi:cadherin-17 [Pelodytes ibericus]
MLSLLTSSGVLALLGLTAQVHTVMKLILEAQQRCQSLRVVAGSQCKKSPCTFTKRNVCPLYNPPNAGGMVNGQTQPKGTLMNMDIRTNEGPAALIYQFIPRNPSTPLQYVLEGETYGTFEILTGGWLHSLKALDRESRASYTLQVKARNADGVTVEGPNIVNIIVEDINDNMPVFNQSSYSGEVREGSRPGIPFVKVYATDADDPETPNAQLVYRITHQIPDPFKVMLFHINNKTGAISNTVNGSQLLNHEVQDNYELLISVSDSAFTANAKVFITVKENIWLSPKPVLIVENSTDQHPFKITQVRWNDQGAIYELHQREKYLKFPFLINQEGDIYVTEPLDREEKAQHIFFAYAKNQNGVQLARPVTIEVNVGDINDNPPVCPAAVTRFEIQDNEGVGSFIGTISATDIDQEDSRNALLHYRIVSQSPTKPDVGMFFVNEYDGNLQLVKSGLDINEVDRYILRINVSDEGVNPTALSTMCIVQIQVIDVNDQIPIFERLDYGNVTVPENSSLEKVIFEIQATDADQPLTGSSQIIYEITNGDPQEMFSVYTNRSTNRGYLIVVKSLDFESFTEHDLVIHARNPEPLFTGINYNESSITRLKVFVTDVDENPVFEQTIYQAQVAEDVPIGTFLIKVSASDPEGDAVIYALKGDRRKWLRINETSGEIFSNAILDRETESHIELEVTASEIKNPRMTSSIFFWLYLNDVNDNAPTLSRDYIGATFCHPLTEPASLIIEGVDADTPLALRRLRFMLGGDENVTKDWEITYLNGSHARLSMKHTNFPSIIVRVPVRIRDSGKPPMEGNVLVPVTLCECTPSKECVPGDLDDFGKPSIGMALGILFGVLAVIGVIIAAVFISIDQKKKKEKKAKGTDAISPAETVNLGS